MAGCCRQYEDGARFVILTTGANDSMKPVHDRMPLILEEDERAAYLVNGKTHTLEKPKKKNKKHYQIIKHIPEDILVQFKKNDSLTDEMIYRMLRAYERSINK